jgi:hypothetical protein
VGLEDSHDVGDGGSLLTDGHVDAVESFGIVGVGVVEGGLLVDDRVDGNGRLAGLSVSNDELSLASSNWDLLKIKFKIKMEANGKIR